MALLLSNKFGVLALILIQVLGACCCWAEATDCCEDQIPSAVVSIECDTTCEEHGSCTTPAPVPAAPRANIDLMPVTAEPIWAPEPFRLLRSHRPLDTGFQSLPLAGVTILRC